MTFVAPIFLLVLALALPVIVAFLVRRRKQVLVVPSVLRWQRVAVAKHRSRRFRNLTRLLALLACVAAVIALGMAAARPRLLGDGALTVLVIDVSPSMGTRDAGPLADALDRARELATAMGPRDRIAIFAAGEAPRRVLAPTDDPSRVRAALDTVRPESRAELERTLVLARALADDETYARVVLLHDGSAEAATVPMDVLEERFGAPDRENVGLTLFAARPARDAANDDEREVLVSVAAAGAHERRVRVRLHAGDVELGARELVVPRGEEADARFRLNLPVRELSASVEPLDARGDTLSTDDRATLRLAAASAPPVRWMTPIANATPPTSPPTPTPSPPTSATPPATTNEDPHATRRHFAEHALRSAGITDFAALEGELPPDAIVVSLGAPSRRVDAPLLVLGGVAPESPPTVPSQDPGQYPHQYPHAAPPPVLAYWPHGVRSLGPLEGDATALHRVDDEHPLTRGLDLDGITILRAIAIDPGEGVPLVELDGTHDESGAREGVVVAAGGEGAGRWVYVGLDPDGSDVVLRVAYPLLVASSLAWLSGSARTEVATTPTRAEVALERTTTERLPFDGPALPLPPLPWILAALAALLLAVEGLAYARRLVS